MSVTADRAFPHAVYMGALFCMMPTVVEKLTTAQLTVRSRIVLY